MAKTRTTAGSPATKRDVNRLMKESANLWEALADVEIKTNVIIGHILEGNDGALIGQLSIAEADKLREIRERLLKLDDQIGPVVEGVNADVSQL